MKTVQLAADATGAIDAAAAVLAAGGVIALPTDTVYGLAADPRRAEGLFVAKGRPRRVDLPVLAADQEQALTLVEDPGPQARRLMARFWPGALTLVLRRRAGLGFQLGDNDHTIGLRCPNHPVPVALARAFGPIATTSANRHGEAPLTSAAAVVEALGDGVSLVLDGGPLQGAPSSVVDCSGAVPQLLREGSLRWATIEAGLD